MDKALSIALQAQGLALTIPAAVDLWTGAGVMQVATAAALAAAGIAMAKRAGE